MLKGEKLAGVSSSTIIESCAGDQRGRADAFKLADLAHHRIKASRKQLCDAME
jgi:hypothetical protein